MDCVWQWGEYDECSRSCGPGTRRRIPEIIVEPQNGGEECPPEVVEERPEIENCNLRSCPGKQIKKIPLQPCLFILFSTEDCEWEYGPFEECSKSCGGGIKNQYPVITRHPTNGGESCPPNVLNDEPNSMECNTDPCPGKV